MEIIIEKVSNGFRQTTIGKLHGRKHVKRTNNIRKIEYLIANLPSNPHFVEINNKDLRIVYSKTDVLILKQYQKNLTTTIYESVLDTIDENTPIVKNVKKNHKKLAALALTTTILVSSIVSGLSLKNDKAIIESNPLQYVVLEDSPSVSHIEPQLVSEDNFVLEHRLMQTKQLVSNQITNNVDIPISTNMNEYSINKVINFINSQDGKYTFQIADEFGIDPYTFICLMMAESSLNHEGTIPGGEYYNGFGVGICQLEEPSGQEITAFNYATNQEETIYETLENALDKKTNIKIGIMRYQNVLEKYHGNERLALQSYNFGYGLVDLIVQIYADEKGISFSDVVDNYEDTGWLKYVKQASSDPVGFVSSLDSNKYNNFISTIDYLKNWQYGSYGNGNYLEDLYSYYLGIYSNNIVNGNIIQTNLTNNEVNKASLDDVRQIDRIM